MTYSNNNNVKVSILDSNCGCILNAASVQIQYLVVRERIQQVVKASAFYFRVPKLLLEIT